MLVALCHRCWTWMEPKHDRCVECGGPFSQLDPDPDRAELMTLFGDPLLVLGEATLKRPRLPTFGVISAFSQGLLFLPDLRPLPSGGLAAIEPAAGTSAQNRAGFWNLFARRMQRGTGEAIPVARPKLNVEAAVDRFLDSPGALFVRRETIAALQPRGTLLRVERKPGRTISWRIESPVADIQEQIRQMVRLPGWQDVPMK